MSGRKVGAIGVLVVAAVMLLAAALAAASTSTTVKAGTFALRNADNTIPVGFDDKTSRFPTFDECQKAAQDKLGAGRYKCDQSTAVTITSTCADEKAPRLYLQKVMIDGMEYLELPGASFTEDTYVELADIYVHNPAWPAGYPNCWVRGQALRSDWRLNTRDDPGKPFMEHVEPGMAYEDQLEELPNDTSYTCWPGDTECLPPPIPVARR